MLHIDFLVLNGCSVALHHIASDLLKTLNTSLEAELHTCVTCQHLLPGFCSQKKKPEITQGELQQTRS